MFSKLNADNRTEKTIPIFQLFIFCNLKIIFVKAYIKIRNDKIRQILSSFFCGLEEKNKIKCHQICTVLSKKLNSFLFQFCQYRICLFVCLFTLVANICIPAYCGYLQYIFFVYVSEYQHINKYLLFLWFVNAAFLYLSIFKFLYRLYFNNKLKN